MNTKYAFQAETWAPPNRAPIHESVADDLRRVLAGRELDTKIEPEPELAKRYGISIPTLRNATLILEREGVLKRRQGSGTYLVGRGAIGGHYSVCLSLSLNMLHYPCSCAYHLRQAHEIYRQLADKGIASQIVLTDLERGTGQDEVKRFLEGRSAKCLVALSQLPGDLTDLAHARGVRLTGAGAVSGKPLSLDYKEFVSLALTEVQAQGGQRVAFLGWSPEEAQINVQMEKQVFLKEVEKLGLRTRASWIIGDLDPKESVSGWAAFREFWTVSSDHPDSLIISDEALLPGALQAMSDLGLSPGNGFCVVAHGNSPDLKPMESKNVTRLWYAIEDFAAAHVDAIEASLAGRPLGQAVRIRPTIERPEGAFAQVNAAVPV
ncbi:MAG: GntR family transcriptional regulator [Verrucomicrobia bacterium]|nr:GntR family transcriptional regulator [Verrucomicrobiota bacterium]